MTINDFSSALEILCGYNLVNAIHKNDGIFKVLDFTSHKKDHISRIKASISEKVKELIRATMEDGQREDKLQSIVLSRIALQDLTKTDERHEARSSNMYLVAGIFAFLMIICSPFLDEYHKLNSVALLAMLTVVLYFIFCRCDHVEIPRVWKGISIGIVSIVILTSVIARFFIFKDDLMWIVCGLGCFLLILFWKRKFIIRRKVFKGTFILTFLSTPFVPSTHFCYGMIYDASNKFNDRTVGWLFFVILFLTLIPFMYDMYVVSLIESQIKKIGETVKKSYDEEALNSNTPDPGSLDPFNID